MQWWHEVNMEGQQSFYETADGQKEHLLQDRIKSVLDFGGILQPKRTKENWVTAQEVEKQRIKKVRLGSFEMIPCNATAHNNRYNPYR